MLWATYNSPTVTALEMQNGIDNFIINMKLQNCLVDTGVFNMLNLCSVTGIQNIEALKHLNVYPNPSNGNVKIDWKGTGMQIQVIEQGGRVVLSHSIQNSQTIQLNDLQVGMYMVTIKSTNGATATKQLVVL